MNLVNSKQTTLGSRLIYNCLSIFCVLLFSQASFAQKAVPELWSQRVHDDAHVLSQATIDSLENALAAYEDSTSNQIAVLTVQSLDGDELEDYTLRVVEKWKLGQKDKDNGVLLFAAIDDHKMRIEVGEGLEGTLTDATASRIIRNEIAPNFRREDYDAGVKAGVNGIIKAIGGEYVASDDDSSGSSDIDSMTLGQRIGIGLGVFAFLGIFAFFGLFAPGKAGWVLYVFLIPFYAIFFVPFIGSALWFLPGVLYIIIFPILKVLFGRSALGKKISKGMTSGSGGGGWSSGGGSGWSSGGGSSFSGGGGSFGGGGSSGGW